MRTHHFNPSNRQPCWRTNRLAWLVTLLCGLPTAAQALVQIWTGAVNGNWSEGGNWQSGSPPSDLDDLVFPAGEARDDTTNNLAGRTFNSITFSRGRYELYGNTITLLKGIGAGNVDFWLHESQVELDLILGASQTFRAYDRALLVVNGAVALGTNTLTIECQQIFRLNSLISGSGSLILNGPGQTIMGGGLGNSYTGTTHLNAGTLILSKAHGHAIRFGELIIGDGLGGADADAVWVWETNQIGLIPITIRSSGFLDLYNYDCMVSELTLDGGHASSDLGTLTLRGDVTVLSNADRQALVEGHVVLNATRTFTVANSPFSPDLRVTALVSGPGGLTKTGAGALGLYSANAFTGVTTVNQGLLYTYAAGALGTPAAGTVVSNQGVLVLSGGIQVLGESLTLGGFGDSISGALTAVGGSNSWGGNITLDSDTSIKVLTNCFLNLTGAVSGVAGFTKIGPGTLIFSGENANTYAGDTLVNEGTLLLDKSDTDGAMSGSGQLVVGDGVGGPGADLVQELRSFQIAGSVDVTVNYSGTLDLNDHSDTIGGLTIHGGDVTTGSGTLTLGGDLSGTMVNYTCADIYGRLALGATNRRIHVPELSCLAIVANISGTGFTKLGEGDLYLMNSNSYSGLTTVAEGRVNIRHDFALGSSAIGTVVENGASLYLDSVHVAAEPLSISGHGLYEFGALVASRDGLHSNSWTGPITLTGDTWIRTASSNWVNLAAVISGPGGLLKMSGGTLILSGSGGNTFDGDVVLEAGRLELAKTGGDAIPGPGMLTVGDDFGGVESDVVRYLEADQIATTAPIVVNSSGLLDLNGFNDLIGPLIFNGGRMDTGDGTATLQGNISANASDNAQARILGKLYISGPRNVNVDSSPFSPDLAVWAQIRGNGGLTKNGDGELSLSASNSFNGLTTVNAGTLDADHSFALGTTSNGTVVADGASLAVRYDSRVGNESLTVQGVGSGSGALRSAAGSNSWAGPITLGGNTTVQVQRADDWLNLGGPVDGTGNLTKSGVGTLIFSGAGANTYSGRTIVTAGTLELNKSTGNGAVPGELEIGDGDGGSGADVVRLRRGSQVEAWRVTLASSGLFELNGYTEAIGSLSGSGTVDLGDGVLNTGYDDTSTVFTGDITGADGRLGKYGSGTFTLTGTNTYSGLTTVGLGTLLVDGAQPASPVQVNSLRTLGGSGIVGHLTNSGTLRPGAGPGILTCSNLSFAGAGSVFAVELNGPLPGVDHDQMSARGAVNLSDATLQVSLGCAPAEGDQFRIINNNGTDAVVGTFGGLPNGSLLAIDGLSFHVNYAGGTGNDVVLTVTNTALGAAHLALLTGNGNGALDLNECNTLRLVVTNRAPDTVTGLSAVLRTSTPGVWISQGQSPYPDLAPGAAGTNSRPFQLSTLPGFACGTNVELVLTITTSNHGTFTVPWVLPSGSPGQVFRHDNNVSMALFDPGTTDSAVHVTQLTLPLAEVVVSCFITHPSVEDLDLYLVAPDGTTIELSTDNGGAGDNYGQSCGDSQRTVFGDDAKFSITTQAAPFVGRVRPEGQLSALRGKLLNGTWWLRVVDDTAGNAGTLNCWSLHLAQVACTTAGGPCALCPDVTLSGTVTTNDPSYLGGLQLNHLASSCAAPTACPGVTGDSLPRHCDLYPFINGGSNACVTVSLTTTCALFSAVYTNLFDPLHLCANYLADPGEPGSRSCSFNVAPGGVFTVVVSELSPRSSIACGDYTLTVAGGSCAPWLDIALASTNRVVLTWPTFAPDYNLEGATNLHEPPFHFTPVTTPPVTLDRQYAVTNTISGPSRFYRLKSP